MASRSFRTPVRFSFDDGAYPMKLQRHLALTAHSLIMDCTGGAHYSPKWLRSVVFEALGPAGRELYGPVNIGGGRVFYPLCLVPSLTVADRPVSGLSDYVADTSNAVLLDQLADMAHKQPHPGWRPVMDAPRSWLVGVARTYQRVLTALLPIWKAAQPRLAVEQARFDQVCDDIHTRNAFVATVSPEIRADERSLLLSWTKTFEEPGGRGLTLVPLLSGPRSQLILAADGGTVLGYPLSALFNQLRPPAEPRNRLEAVLGPVRASILRHLDGPATLTQVAEVNDLGLSTTNHHVGRLLAAGLATQIRLGRSTWLVRTAEGDKLLHLLD